MGGRGSRGGRVGGGEGVFVWGRLGGRLGGRGECTFFRWVIGRHSYKDSVGFCGIGTPLFQRSFGQSCLKIIYRSSPSS